jgi:malate synthase
MTDEQTTGGIELRGAATPSTDRILTKDALTLVADLERTFGARRRALLARRREVQQRLDAGRVPEFPPETADVRGGDWRVAPVPDILRNRRVEITGPVDAKMMINALNSGADVFMADLEDASSPTWTNMVEGQSHLMDAVRGTLSYSSEDGKEYRLAAKTATLFVRPRGWHLEEKHLLVDGRPVSGSLFDLGLYCFHNAARLAADDRGPFFYLPKLENHLEARLWNDVFCRVQDTLGLKRGTIKATVLLENVLAAFEMEEILYELREHSAGLNAGRWDYIFSVIKKFGRRPDALLPDRDQVTMTVPFMRAYTTRLVRACHGHGAFAIGGMAAFIPSRRDVAVNERALAKVREDKEREVGDGFDGTWIAHPDLVAPVRAVFDPALGDRPNQLDVVPERAVAAAELIDFRIPNGTITERGIRHNVSVALLYIASWLRGTGAAAIYNLMEDTATAEISRSQLWQWLHRDDARLDDGRTVTADLYRGIVPQELDKIRAAVGDESFAAGRYDEAAALLDSLVLADDFPDFLTLSAYEHLD